MSDLPRYRTPQPWTVTIYCGSRGPVQDIEVNAIRPSTAIAIAMLKLPSRLQAQVTEIRVNRRYPPREGEP